MNRHYYRLKKRLTYNERWSENFLEIERNKEIARGVLKKLAKKSPFLYFLFIILYLPTNILEYFKSLYWWYEYDKCCEEIKIIKKEIESYE